MAGLDGRWWCGGTWAGWVLRPRGRAPFPARSRPPPPPRPPKHTLKSKFDEASCKMWIGAKWKKKINVADRVINKREI